MDRRVNGWRWIAAAFVLVCVATAGQKAVRAETFQGAVLEERKEQTLYFSYVEDRKINTVFGRLTDRTKVLDADGSTLSKQAVQAGSAWNLALEDSQPSLEAPEIEEMIRIQPAPLR